MEGWRETEYGRSLRGTPLRAFGPDGGGPARGLLVAALHGEEPETLWLARRLLERVHGTETGWWVVPCANPDGVVDGTRQNAAGVDLNRNFPSASWRAGDSFTYPPGCLARERPNRTNRSSTGVRAGSEPETRALLALVERLAPPVILDLHAPLELIAPTPAAPPEAVERLATAAALPVYADTGAPTPGALRDWCTDVGLGAITYEVEHAGLPALGVRHLHGLETLLRGSTAPPEGEDGAATATGGRAACT